MKIWSKKSIIHEMAVMKHENPICEEDSMAFGKESVRSELSNAVFETFLSFLKRKLKHFQTVRFLINFIQRI